MIVFFASEKPREQELADAFLAGARAHGWAAEKRALCAMPDLAGIDVACMVGVKSKRLFERCTQAGVLQIMLDKGYIRSRRADARTWEFWRVAVGAHHPTRTTLMSHKLPSDRLEALALELKPWRVRGFSIVIAGSSAKYHSFYGLPDPNEYYRDLVRQIRQITDLPIVYRPKPSYREAEPITKTEWSGHNESIMGALDGAWALVTHGSNACFEAALRGIPSIVLGDGVAAPISSTSLDDLAKPKIGKRDQWLANLAYHQWTEREMRSGQAWATIGGWVDERRKQIA